MGNRTRRKKQVTVTGAEISEAYCRRCMKQKRADQFFSAVDLTLDKNGLMSVCKDCINEMFAQFLPAEGSIQKAVLRLCRMLNLKYSEEAIAAAVTQIENARAEGKPEPQFFGVYKARLLLFFRTGRDDVSPDLTYSEVTQINISGQEFVGDGMVSQDVIDFWGTGYKIEDYRWLEYQLNDWKKTHKCDTKAEETLLREIVFKQWDIEKDRKSGTTVGSKVKELQDLMKTANLDPAKANALSGAGRGVETFGDFIRVIEEVEPAEYYEDRELFKDFDNIGKYFEKYVTRAIKNFIVGSRDFNIDHESDVPEDDDGEPSEATNPEVED